MATERDVIVQQAANIAKMRSKILNQRTELRRLNRRLQAMWEGVRFSHKVRHEMQMRDKQEELQCSQS